MEEGLNTKDVSVERIEASSDIENTNIIDEKSSIDNLENNVDDNLKPTEVQEKDTIFVDEFPVEKNIEKDKVENNDTIFVDEFPEKLRTPISNGNWDGQIGNSNWTPDNTYAPQKNNPDGENWKEIKQSHNIDSITFKEGYPDFTPVAKAEVEIDNFTSKRYGVGANFDQADTKLAEQKGLKKEEIVQDRIENDFTWHEHENCKTMQLVPCEIHNNIPHSGGISAVKQKNKI